MSIFNKRIFGFAAIVFGILVSATAVAHTDGIYNRAANSVGDTQGIDSAASGSAPPAYTGPGDIQTTGVIAWWGLRAYSVAKRGTKVANVCNSTGGVDVGCADMLSDATTGALVPQTISSITCPGANCTVKTLYDQSGALKCSAPTTCDFVQATVANRPLLVANCIGSLPCMQFVRATPTGMDFSSNSFVGATAQPITVSVASNRTGSTTSINGIVTAVGPNFNRQFAYDTTNRVYIFPGAGNVNSAAVSNNAWHAFQAVFNSASSLINLDGVDGSTSSQGTDGMSAGAGANLGNDTFGSSLDGNILELGYWSVSFTTTGKSAPMSSNQHAFWGF